MIMYLIIFFRKNKGKIHIFDIFENPNPTRVPVFFKIQTHFFKTRAGNPFTNVIFLLLFLGVKVHSGLKHEKKSILASDGFG